MVHLDVYRYWLPCTKRGTAFFKSGFREGLIVTLRTKNLLGLAEYAPFSFHNHCHSILDVTAMLGDLNKSSLLEMLSLKDLSLEELFLFFKSYPYPISYLLSMLHLSLRCNEKVIENKKALSISALIEDLDVFDAVKLAHGFCSQGFSCLKIKVGKLSVEEEIKKVKLIAACLGRHTTLRLDANKRFTFKEAQYFLTSLKKIKIDYFEEPLFDINGLDALADEFAINIALDESFNNPFDLTALRKNRINVLVIKPSRFNNLYQALYLAQNAKKYHVEPIFSHCFESEFSSAIFALALEELSLSNIAHGIVAEGFFKANLSSLPLRLFRGRLFFENAQNMIKNAQLKTSRLKKILTLVVSTKKVEVY